MVIAKKQSTNTEKTKINRKWFQRSNATIGKIQVGSEVTHIGQKNQIKVLV